jgi:hypothetical protein
MTVGERDLKQPDNDRAAVRTLRRATGIPAPVRLPPRQPDDQVSPAPAVAPVLTPDPELSPSTPSAASSAAPSEGADLAGVLALLADPREVTRRYKDDHELGGSKSDTFTLPVELFQTLNRVCKERRVVKKWLVAAALEALFEAWVEEIRLD